MQITVGTQYNMSWRNHLKKNQNTPRPSEHPRVIKASTRMILVHVQKMYNIFRVLIGVPDYSSSSFFLMKRKLSPPPRQNKILGSYPPPPPTNKILRVYYIGIPIQQVKKKKKTLHGI